MTQHYPLLLDTFSLYVEWETLVSKQACRGKVAHDARYVAAMKTHGVTHIQTFNVSDFTRFPGISILDPSVVAAAIPPDAIP